MLQGALHSFFLCLGSNTANGRALVKRAIGILKTQFEVKAVTPTIRTASIGNKACRYYYNSGVCLETSLSKDELKSCLRNIELDFGRIKGSDLVTLDIDIIRVDGEAVHEDDKKQYVRYLMNQLALKMGKM